MKKYIPSALALILLSVSTFAPYISVQAAPADYPTWVIAPSIGLFSPMEAMGINNKGELDVPDGKTNNVGWYAGGVVPGNEGTAVLDAHVFAAFKELNKVRPGEYIYMFMSSGKILSFRVTDYNVYNLNNLSPRTLFAPTSKKQMNLITCAGEWVPSLGTYTERLIVTAELV